MIITNASATSAAKTASAIAWGWIARRTWEYASVRSVKNMSFGSPPCARTTDARPFRNSGRSARPCFSRTTSNPYSCVSFGCSRRNAGVKYANGSASYSAVATTSFG